MSVCPICLSKRSNLVEKYGKYSVVHCLNCNVVFSDPMKNPGPDWYEENKFYEVERQYTRLSTKSSSHLQFLSKDEKFLKKIQCDKLRLLDIGCGRGLFLERVKEKFASVVGVDFESEAIEIGRAKGLEVYCMEISRFLNEYSGEKFDVITVRYVLEHVENPREIIMSVRKLLNPGGYILVTVPNIDCKIINPENNKIFLYPPHHLTLWSKKAVRNLFEISGYEVLKIDSGLVIDDINDFVTTSFLGTVYTVKKALLTKKRTVLLDFLRAFKRWTVRFFAFLALPLLRIFLREGEIILCVARLNGQAEPLQQKGVIAK